MAIHDPQSFARRGQQLQSILIAHLALSWLFIALRTYTRIYVKPNFGWDDFAMIFAGMIFTSYCGCLFYIEAHGGGTHVTSVAQLSELTKRAVASEATYIATVMMLKISVSIFFARIVVKRWQLIVIYATITISCVSASASFFYCIFRCGPDLDQYVMRQLSNLCTPRGLDRFFAYQHAAFAFTTDCVFVVLPIPLLWNTNMSRKSKFSIGFILSLATLGCVCSAIRFRYVEGLTQIEDFFWNASNISIWSTIEPGAGIMAGCMATLRPLMKRTLIKVQSLRSSITVNRKEYQPTELGSGSSNEAGGVAKREEVSNLSKNPRLAPKAQIREIDPLRASQSSDRGITEGILSRTEVRPMLAQEKSLELDRSRTCASVVRESNGKVRRTLPMLRNAKQHPHKDG